jgi:hypothetical protein
LNVVFPKIKRSKRSPLHSFDDWIHGHTPESIAAERASRAKWARALAFAVHNYIIENGEEIYDEKLNLIQEELLKQAERDEK